MQLTFETENASELKQQVVDFCNVFGVAILKIVPSEGIPEGYPDGETPKKVTKKKAKKKEEDIFEDVPPDAPAETPIEHMEEPKPFTRDQVMGALLDLTKEKGMIEAKGLLGKFGAQRISELQETDFAAFIHLAQAMINDRA